MTYARVKPQFFGRWHIFNGEAYLCEGDEEPDEFADELPGGDKVCEFCQHVEAGYKVEKIRGGQTRCYGPTINTYHVTDLTGEREKDEVLAYCRERVRRGKMKGEDGYHPLTPHVMGFHQRNDGKWFYEVGHEYTG